LLYGILDSETSKRKSKNEVKKERKMQLLKEFGSLTQLRKVSALEICEKIPNIGESLANKIVEYINK
jgi:excinuclease UvrABC nuclease subunit